MTKVYRISAPAGKLSGTITLDGSKSISNRVLIIQSLCEDTFEITGLSTGKDTNTLKAMLASSDSELDAGHAGTSFRFMTARASIGDRDLMLTGSARMKQRPIGQLVEALRAIGVNIKYLGEQGYPPLHISHVDVSRLQSQVHIKADISSQYITALLLIAPTLPNGLQIILEGELVSRPYIEMTLALMQHFGVSHKWDENIIEVSQQSYEPENIHIEADWSAASYFFSLVALSEAGTITLKGLQNPSLQGDAQIAEISARFGLDVSWHQGGLVISKSGINNKYDEVIDFTSCPDIAQTIALIAAGTGMPLGLTGLQTLVIKETDRIKALQRELAKIDVRMEALPSGDDLPRGHQNYQIAGRARFSGVPRFSTYQDHRMAMAFAPLALLNPIEIEDPDVVVKSYPDFWKDLEKLDFKVEEVTD